MDKARRRAGLTLIEVVAAMALMAGVLTAALVARGRLTEQGQRAEIRQQAVELLTEIVADGNEAIGSGSFRRGNFFVVIDERSPGSLDTLGLDVRTFSVYPADAPGAMALASVERFVPRPEPFASVDDRIGGAR
ncbi:MAG: prepilin-type N-terminal cleavage/methylation domain-containing protein [Planctomycetota bacterium]